MENRLVVNLLAFALGGAAPQLHRALAGGSR